MGRRPPLVVFCGVPGCGKTTIARIVCERIPGAVHVQTDSVRRMIARPRYDGPESAFVYDSCVRVAEEALRRGRPAVLDGTFARNYYRTQAITRLERLYGRLVLVHVVCRIDTAMRRNSSRSAVVPEARLKGIYADFEEPPGALKIDSDAFSPEENADVILAAVALGGR